MFDFLNGHFNFSDWKEKMKIFTLVLVTRNSEILLGLKKRGLGEGKWNGFGGKVEFGETVIRAAMRSDHNFLN